MKSLNQYLTELSNKTMASYKNKAKREANSVRRVDDKGNAFGYRIDYFHNPSKLKNRHRGIKTAEKKLEARYAHLKESEDSARLARISSPAVDLITFPKGVDGTNCGNCKYFSDGQCENKKVLSPVTVHMCCNLWDHEGTLESGKNKACVRPPFRV
jgi:hypothetical protein